MNNHLIKLLKGLGISEADMPRAIKNMMDFSRQVRMIESSNDKMRTPGIEGNTAKGFYQFTDDSVDTGIQRMKNMQSKYGVFDDNYINFFEENRNPQSWDDEQSDSMFFANLFSAPGSDTDLKEVARGSHQARQNLYQNIHHTNPNEATINVMNREMPVLNQPVDDLLANYNKKKL
jgi:hypothetical protein